MELTSDTLSENATSHVQYIHEFLEATEEIAFDPAPIDRLLLRRHGGFGLSPYPFEKIEAHLNKRASEGWKLAFMEPHWSYETHELKFREGLPNPLCILGWYLTFEKR